MRGAMPLLRSQARWAPDAYALSACSFAGRLRGRPASPDTDGTASSSGISMREHVPEPPICSPPEVVRAGRRAGGACSRACRSRWDWGWQAVRRGGDGTLAESILARSH